MTRVAVLDDFEDGVGRSSWLARLHGLASVEIYTDAAADEAELVRRLAHFEVVIPIRERTRFTRSILAQLPDLRLLALTGRNIGQVDLEAASQYGVAVTETDGSGAAAFELTLALMFALVRQVARNDRRIRDGGWYGRLGAELEGRTLGILGLGRIGSRVARVAQGLGMTVLAAGPTLTPERARAAGVGFREMDDLFRESDVLTVHLRLSEASRGIVTAGRLRSMKPSAYLVNTARGDLIDQAALVTVLQRTGIAGAALDVYVHEPLPADDPLRSLDNVLLSPHVGYATEEAFAVFFEGAAAQIEAYLKGEVPTRILDAEVLGDRVASQSSV